MALVSMALVSIVSTLVALYVKIHYFENSNLSFIDIVKLTHNSGALYGTFCSMMIILAVLTIAEGINVKHKNLLTTSSYLVAFFLAFYVSDNSREYFGRDIVSIDSSTTCTMQIIDNKEILDCGNEYIYTFTRL